MNNYWNDEPKIFWYKKKVRKSQEFLTQRSDPPPRGDFLKKFLTSFFYGPLQEIGIKNSIQEISTKFNTVYKKSIQNFTRKIQYKCQSQNRFKNFIPIFEK